MINLNDEIELAAAKIELAEIFLYTWAEAGHPGFQHRFIQAAGTLAGKRGEDPGKAISRVELALATLARGLGDIRNDRFAMAKKIHEDRTSKAVNPNEDLRRYTAA